jgi:hypothetical protein
VNFRANKKELEFTFDLVASLPKESAKETNSKLGKVEIDPPKPPVASIVEDPKVVSEKATEKLLAALTKLNLLSGAVSPQVQSDLAQEILPLLNNMKNSAFSKGMDVGQNSSTTAHQRIQL